MELKTSYISNWNSRYIEFNFNQVEPQHNKEESNLLEQAIFCYESKPIRSDVYTVCEFSELPEFVKDYALELKTQSENKRDSILIAVLMNNISIADCLLRIKGDYVSVILEFWRLFYPSINLEDRSYRGGPFKFTRQSVFTYENSFLGNFSSKLLSVDYWNQFHKIDDFSIRSSYNPLNHRDVHLERRSVQTTNNKRQLCSNFYLLRPSNNPDVVVGTSYFGQLLYENDLVMVKSKYTEEVFIGAIKKTAEAVEIVCSDRVIIPISSCDVIEVLPDQLYTSLIDRN